MALSEFKIKSAKPKEKPYRLTDGGGLVLNIHSNGSKYWQLRYRFEKKENTLSLGIYPATSLNEARLARDKAKKILMEGLDPNRQQGDLVYQDKLNFETVARKWCKNQLNWSDAHRHRVLRTLELNLFPIIGHLAITELTTKSLLIPIKNVEVKGTIELASRLQQRIHSIMRYCVQNGYLDYNPAQDLTGCVTKSKVVHRPALELNQLPELLKSIDNYPYRKITQLALKLSLLIFVRSSELRYARWSEINFEKRIWTIPAEREVIAGSRYSYRGSKMKSPHLVPLSAQAIDILKQLNDISGQYELIFIGDHDPYKPMSENTINHALRKMGYDTQTVLCGHGFRTMACSALIESGLWSRDAVERQMSHQERNRVRAAYIHKAEHINERIQMVQWWANYLDIIKNDFIMPYEFKPE